MIPSVASIDAAAAGFDGRIHRTPLIQSHSLSSARGGPVFLKCENEQVTGSFKARGALHKVNSVMRGCLEGSPPPPFTTASTGNHALGCIHAMSCHATTMPQLEVFVPENVHPAKLAKVKKHAGGDGLKVSVKVAGKTPLDTEMLARARAAETGGCYVSPYNDVDVVAGQGTVGKEIHEQIISATDNNKMVVVFVAVGGGGLISGIGSYLRGVKASSYKIIGVSPSADAAMSQSIRAGRIVPATPSDPTLSEATAGDVEDDSITFTICQEVVQMWVDVTEQEIAAAWRSLRREFPEMALEGAAACAAAGLAKYRTNKTAEDEDCVSVVVLCGGNVSKEQIAYMETAYLS